MSDSPKPDKDLQEQIGEAIKRIGNLYIDMSRLMNQPQHFDLTTMNSIEKFNKELLSQVEFITHVLRNAELSVSSQGDE